MDNTQVAVIIPCFNSQERIAQVILEVKQFVKDVIVIDDGSQDHSAKYAETNGAKVIPLVENKGVGFATRTGMQAALEMGKQVIITIDADGAHNPIDIPRLLKTHVNTENALTIGNRWSKFKTAIPSQKWWANQFACTLINKIAKTNIPDVACGFRVFNKQLIEKLVKTEVAEGFGFIYQVIFETKFLGQIGSVPIDIRYDSNHLLATKQKELLNFLDISLQYSSDDRQQFGIQVIREKSVNLQKFGVKLKINSKYDHLVLYPLKEHSSYLFQWQHPDFVTDPKEYIEI